MVVFHGPGRDSDQAPPEWSQLAPRLAVDVGVEPYRTA
jgi:hypothetical protein